MKDELTFEITRLSNGYYTLEYRVPGIDKLIPVLNHSKNVNDYSLREFSTYFQVEGEVIAIRKHWDEMHPDTKLILYDLYRTS